MGDQAGSSGTDEGGTTWWYEGSRSGCGTAETSDVRPRKFEAGGDRSVKFWESSVLIQQGRLVCSVHRGPKGNSRGVGAAGAVFVSGSSARRLGGRAS